MDEIKKLGFGMMRLPKDGDGFDIEKTKEMVDKFMAAGFTYFDTAWAYDGSEEATRKALVERYPRESYQLATKLSAWAGCKTKEDAIAQFDVSLERTGAGYFDYYLLHNFGANRSAKYDEFELWDWIIEKKKEGLIKHIGFSAHTTPEEIEDILTKHPEMEFVQLQINYADMDNPAIMARACYEVCRKHNKPIIIMEPVKGGLLANPPKQVADVFKQADPDASVASWALKFAANLEGVMVVLSGMSTPEQVEDNISSMINFTGLTDHELEVIARAQEELAKIPVVPCTQCNYCAKVCPIGIGIPETFAAYNMLKMYDDFRFARGSLSFNVKKMGLKYGTECIKCGLCEGACPQHIAIRDELERASKEFKLEK